MKTKKFSVKIDNLELRSCDRNLMQDGEHVTAEICFWGVTSCHTIAYWSVDNNDGGVGTLMFVGSAPLNFDDEKFMYLVRMGFTLLS